MTDVPESTNQAPKVYPIPEQLVQAGKHKQIDFTNFVVIHSDESLRFEIEDGPEEFQLNSETGLYSGVAPKLELNKSYLPTLIVTDLNNKLVTRSFFRLEIIGTLLLETEEGRAFFAKEEVNFWDAAKSWELQQFIQHIIVEHYAWVVMFNENVTRWSQIGELIDKRIAKSGWTILEFEDVVMVTPGDKAFEDYGSRRRILDTLREALIDVVTPKDWSFIEIDGSDIESIGKCWVVARELELPVSQLAPSDIAEVNYYNIKRVFPELTPSRPKPQPS